MIFASTMCLKGGTSMFETDVMHVLEAYKKLKIKNIELGSGHANVDVKKVIKFGKENECKFICHGNFPPSGEKMMGNAASQSPLMQKTVMSTAKAAIEFLNKTNSELYSVHGGYTADILPNHGQMSDKITEKKAIETAANTIGQICDYAQYYNVKVAIETSPPFPFAVFVDPADFKELFKKVSKSNLGILIDLGHIKLSEQKLNIPRENFIKLQKKALEFHCHQVIQGKDHHKISDANSIFEGFDKEILKSASLTLESNGLNEKQIMESLAAISSYLA